MKVYCAECDKEIQPGDEYYTYQDNHVQMLFENEELNIFCSAECAAQALMLTSDELEAAEFERLLRERKEDEKYNLYLDLLDAYADKVPNRIKGGLRPIYISEANSLEGSKFIDGLLYHLATECGLKPDLQATVQEVLQEWEAWRGPGRYIKNAHAIRL